MDSLQRWSVTCHKRGVFLSRKRGVQVVAMDYNGQPLATQLCCRSGKQRALRTNPDDARAPPRDRRRLRLAPTYGVEL